MLKNKDNSNQDNDPRNIFVGVPELIARYGRGRTTIYEIEVI